MLEDGGDGVDCVFADVGVAVLETGACGGEEGLDELGLAEFAEEAEGIAANVFVGVLEVVADAVAMGRLSLCR